MENIPFYVYAVFVLTLIATLYVFYKATQKSKGFMVVVSIWLSIQSIIGFLGFYMVSNTNPPRFQLLLLPPLLFIIVQFLTKKGRLFIASLDLKVLTIIHIVRIPVEMVLYWLFVARYVPEQMTFEGRNFDVISGITAPLIFYFGFVTKRLNKYLIITWNILCLGLLFNIIINAILSSPSRFQQFGFEQPNVALLHFPFMFLPAFIVPVLLFSHFVSIRQFIISK